MLTMETTTRKLQTYSKSKRKKKKKKKAGRRVTRARTHRSDGISKTQELSDQGRGEGQTKSMHLQKDTILEGLWQLLNQAGQKS